MSSPYRNNHDLFKNKEYYDLDQWVCSTCLKNVSSCRPPVYNSDNCSCADLGGTHVPKPAASPEQGYEYLNHFPGQGIQYQHNDAAFFPPPASTSSTESVPCPEGVEGIEPNLHVGNQYLPIAPDIGHNESQHRHSAFVQSNMTEPMRRFLKEQKNNRPRQGIPLHSDSKFLNQETHIMSAKKEKKGKMRSERSYESLGSSGHEDFGFVVGADAMAYVGHWAEQRTRSGVAYEMILSLSPETDDLDD